MLYKKIYIYSYEKTKNAPFTYLSACFRQTLQPSLETKKMQTIDFI